LMQSMAGVRVVSASADVPEYDCWIDQVSLPRVLGTTLNTIPTPAGYLSADPIRVRTWRGRLGVGSQTGTFSVGVAFSGNPRHPADRRRSIPPDLDIQLPEIPGLRFVSLQHDASGHSIDLPDMSQWMTDFAETAALIATLDLVITVDTSVAHLAGALGKPVWILLPYAPDWRWMLRRADSPWYRSVRLFRQPAAGDWTSVLTEVMSELAARVLEDAGSGGCALASARE
jgi:hypothetical protein